MLVHYDGAVRHVIAAEIAKEQGSTPVPVGGNAGSEVLSLSGEAIAAMAGGDWTG